MRVELWTRGYGVQVLVMWRMAGAGYCFSCIGSQ